MQSNLQPPRGTACLDIARSLHSSTNKQLLFAVVFSPPNGLLVYIEYIYIYVCVCVCVCTCAHVCMWSMVNFTKSLLC